MRYLVLLLAALAPLVPCNVQAAPPANDKLEGAQVIPTDSSISRIQGTVADATTEIYPVFEGGSTGFRSFPYAVWYKWTAPVGGLVTITAVSPGFLLFGETFSGTDATDLALVAEDNASDYINGSYLNSYSFTAVAGTTYFTAIKDTFGEHTPGNGSAFFLAYSFNADSLSDAFATRTRIYGNNIVIPGSNIDYTKEAGEPDHGSNSDLAAGKTAWITWRSADTRKSVTVQVTSRLFIPLVAVYTGDSLATLTRVARSTTSSSSDGTRATVTFVAEDGVDYHIAVDGARGGSGVFGVDFKATTVRPGFFSQPAPTTVTQGDTAILTVAAAYTGDTVSYQWERAPAGSSAFTPIGDDEIFSGTDTASLSIITSLSMNNDRYRVKVTDSVDSSYSKSALLTVTEFFPVTTEVLGTISPSSATPLNIANGTIPAPTNGGVYFATGLPKGLSIDPATGEISGVVTGKPGTYKVTYGSTDGKKKNATTFVVQIVVAPYSTYLQGSFEALLTSPDSLALPEGKLSLKVTSTGSYTGTYFSLDEGKTYSFRGTVSLNQDLRTAGNAAGTPIVISRGKILPPLKLNLSIAEPADSAGKSVLSASLLNDVDTLIAESDEGEPLGTFNATAPALWGGSYTGLLSDVQKTVPGSVLPIPQGDGFVTGSVAVNTGVATLRGRTAEGVAFTASLRSSAQGSYRLAQRVFSGTGGQISGSFTLVEQLTSLTGAYNVPEEGNTRLYVAKPAVAKDRVYPLGYETLSYRFNLERWVKPVAANGETLPGSLSLADGGSVSIEIYGDGVSNMDTNLRGLPVNLNIGTNGKVTVADVNTTAKLAVSINATNGSFTGSFVISDPATPPAVKPVTRKISVNGVMMQKSGILEGSVVGSGYLLLPPLPGTTDTTTAGAFRIFAGAPSLPF